MAIGEWKINGATLDSLCVREARLSLANRGGDELSLVIAGDLAGVNPFSYGQAVTVTRDGVTMFSGTVQVPGRDLSRATPSFEIVVVNGWQDLQDRTYENVTRHFDTNSKTVVEFSVPEAYLGQDEAGEHITTGAVMAEAIDFAVSKGDDVTKGTILTGRLAPQTLASDLSCLDVINKMLVYHPAAIAWMDGDTLNIREPADLSTVVIDPATDGPLTVRVADRSHLVPVGVRIVWKKLVTKDGDALVNYTEDLAGSASGKPACRVFMIELAGANVTSERVEIGTRSLPDPNELGASTGPAAVTAKRFYMANLSFLAGADTDDLVIEGQSLELIDPGEDAWDYDNEQIENPNLSTLPDAVKAKSEEELYEDYPRQLTRGKVEPWMGVELYPARLKATIFYKGDDVDIIRAMGGVRKYSQSAGEYYSAMEFDQVIEITDALPRPYERTESFEVGGSPLPGLASDYYAAINRARFDGQMEAPLWGSAKFPTLRPGVKVLVTGETASAVPVEMAVFDLMNDAGQWSFGVPKHLELGDLYELSQVSNVNPPSWFFDEERTEATRSPFKTLNTSIPRPEARSKKSDTKASKPWDLDVYVDASDTVKFRLKPGVIKSSGDYDADAVMTIADMDAERGVPSNLQAMYLQFDFNTTTRVLSAVSLELGDRWAEWPSPFKLVEGGTFRMQSFYWPLYSFHTASGIDVSAENVTLITSTIAAVKLVPDHYAFRLVDAVHVDNTGSRTQVVQMAVCEGVAPV